MQVFQPSKFEHNTPCGSLPKEDGVCQTNEPRVVASPTVSPELSTEHKAPRHHDHRHLLVREKLQRLRVTKQLETELCGSYGRRASSQPCRDDHRPRHARGPKALLQTIRDVSRDIGSNVASSFTNVASAGLRFPVTLMMSLALGFHNAPKLYGDKTVRPSPPTRVASFTHGLKYGSQELWNQMSDAITGIVLLPMQGVREEGVMGLAKGVGKGVGGLALKPMAAICGFPAYALKGLHKELRKADILDFTAHIDAARTAQGEDEWEHATDEEKEKIVDVWKELVRDSVVGEKYLRRGICRLPMILPDT